MEIKEMRDILKDIVDVVPRSNDDVIRLYDEKFPSEAVEADEIKPVEKDNVVNIVSKDNTYTYVGSGESSPSVINYMGLQVFSRGQAIEVTNPQVLAKIGGNKCFVKGSVSADYLYEIDQEGKKHSEKQRQEDVETQILVERQYRKA